MDNTELIMHIYSVYSCSYLFSFSRSICFEWIEEEESEKRKRDDINNNNNNNKKPGEQKKTSRKRVCQSHSVSTDSVCRYILILIDCCFLRKNFGFNFFSVYFFLFSSFFSFLILMLSCVCCVCDTSKINLHCWTDGSKVHSNGEQNKDYL